MIAITSVMRTNERLLAWRLAEGLSQREAAKLAELSQPAWQSYEAGTSMPKIDAAQRIEHVTRGPKQIKVSDWTETKRERAARKLRSAARRVRRAVPQRATG